MAAPDIQSKEYAQWLEGCVRTMFDEDPQCIMMQMIGKDGQISTCYWECSIDDMALIIDALVEEKHLAWIESNRDVINDILRGNDEDEVENDEDNGEAGEGQDAVGSH